MSNEYLMRRFPGAFERALDGRIIPVGVEINGQRVRPPEHTWYMCPVNIGGPKQESIYFNGVLWTRHGGYARDDGLHSPKWNIAAHYGQEGYHYWVYAADPAADELFELYNKSNEPRPASWPTFLNFEAYSNNHIVRVYDDGIIAVGCEEHEIDYWRENADQIGRANNYTSSEIEVYKHLIEAAHAAYEHQPIRRTFKRGDKFTSPEEPGQTYLLCDSIEPEQTTLVSIETGIVWRRASTTSKPSLEEIHEAFGDHWTPVDN